MDPPVCWEAWLKGEDLVSEDFERRVLLLWRVTAAAAAAVRTVVTVTAAEAAVRLLKLGSGTSWEVGGCRVTG